MRRLQVLVAVMTILLFAGMALLVYGFVSKGAELGAQMAAPAAGSEGEIIVPPSSTVLQMAPWRDGVALHLKVRGEGEFIYLVRQNGTVASKLALRSEKDAVPEK